MGCRSSLCRKWNRSSFDSVAEYICTGTLTSPNEIDPLQIGRMPSLYRDCCGEKLVDEGFGILSPGRHGVETGRVRSEKLIPRPGGHTRGRPSRRPRGVLKRLKTLWMLWIAGPAPTVENRQDPLRRAGSAVPAV